MHQIPPRIAVPAEPVGRPRQPKRHDDQLCRRPHDRPQHQRPDRFHHEGQRDDRQIANDLRAQVQRRHTPQQQMPVGGINPRRVEPRDQQGDPRRRQQPRQIGCRVKHRYRISQRTGQAPQKPPPQHVDRKGGVQKRRLVTTRMLADRGADPHVRKHRQPDQHHRHQRHHTERFGKQQPRQHKVGGQPHHLHDGIRPRRKRRPAQRPCEQSPDWRLIGSDLRHSRPLLTARTLGASRAARQSPASGPAYGLLLPHPAAKRRHRYRVIV